MRISDWSSDVCSSDLLGTGHDLRRVDEAQRNEQPDQRGQHVDDRHGVDRLARPDPRREHGVVERDDEGLAGRDRKSVVSGKRVSVRVDLGGRRIIKKKKTTMYSAVS